MTKSPKTGWILGAHFSGVSGGLFQKRLTYGEACAKARACGYEVESFEEYIGERSLRQEREEFYASLDPAILDLY